MRRYLLDTGIMGAFIDHQPPVADRVREVRRRGDRIGTCFPVICELSYGVEFSASPDENLRRLVRSVSGISCWPLDRKAAQEYGKLAAELRRIGRPMQQIDIQTAAISLALGNCTVVSRDSDFTTIRGLTLENWVT
ncbi:MAG TPA: type II toxin-antitoxin system VapC family toxin [Gemmataceae bacterium]|jgi:tRNA(fMet)-specific endonuclease VapC|nr:type II toxin-antitoxin system VapC family toxin [Gemmataceae bacterium]